MKTVCGITFEENKLLEELKFFTDRLKEFLNKEEIQELIDDNKWEQIIDKWVNYCSVIGGIMVSLLLSANIPFLDYIDTLKLNYFYNSEAISKINLPNTIVTIQREAIQDYYNSIKEITLPKSIQWLESRAFLMSETPITSINYLGTKKEWKNINKAKDWFFDVLRSTNPIKIIHCSDGDINL